MPDKTPPQTRRARLWRTAESQGIPLRAILATVAVVVVTFMAGKLLYRLRDVVLLMAVSGFVALLLNPLVVYLQRWKVHRRGFAVAIVTFWAVLVFVGLAIAFGYPLINGVTHLADRLPSYVDQAQHGRGWIGQLIRRYHVTAWVQHNSAKITSFAQSLGKPALALGKGAVSLLVALGTIFFLVLLLLLEGPRMRSWILSNMTQERAATVTRVSAQVNRAVTGYMAGNLLTSVIAGAVVFVTLLVLGVPFPFLWALWVALVDFLPMIGGALAGIPTVLFATTHSLTAGIVTLVVFLAYTQIREPRAEPGGHEQDGADQPAARARLDPGRGLHRQLDRRAVRRLRRGAARHPGRGRRPGDRQRTLARHGAIGRRRGPPAARNPARWRPLVPGLRWVRAVPGRPGPGQPVPGRPPEPAGAQAAGSEPASVTKPAN